MPSIESDVVIIGAGAAGLAAADRLAAGGGRSVLLEARDRIGGRIHTRHARAVPLPIELGAEFLHGEAPDTTAVLAAASEPVLEMTGEFWTLDRGRLRERDGAWAEMGDLMGRLDPQRSPDRSFAEFLAERPGGQRLAAARRLARMFVEGFDAADTTRMSERALARWHRDEGEAFRGRVVVAGYDRVPHLLADRAAPRARVHLETVVTRVEWKRGSVRVIAAAPHGATTTVSARAAIITLPIGVLQAQSRSRGAVTFDPAVDAVRHAAEGLRMGAVVRVVCWFREALWEGQVPSVPRGSRLTCARFLQAPGSDAAFRTWWTAYPVHAPMLTAWVGGPRAAALCRRGRGAIRPALIASLSRVLGLPQARIAHALSAWWMHDWIRDPFSRGAYSYPTVSDTDTARELGRPISSTLFFAGDGVVSDARHGTVEGAISSGRQAAEQVLRHL